VLVRLVDQVLGINLNFVPFCCNEFSLKCDDFFKLLI